MKNTAKFEKLAQLMELDKSITYDEAYTRVKNAFDAIYVRGGSVEIHEVLEEANEQYKQKKGNKNMGNKELTIAELLESASPEMLEIIKKRVMGEDNTKQTGKKYEAYLNYAQNNYTSRINADDLLSLESGLLQHLQQVQEALSNQWAADDKRTVREVLESEEMEKCEKL